MQSHVTRYVICMHCIYVVRNTVNHKVYVGQTSNFSQRKASHLHCAKKGDCKPLYCAMRDLGVEKFTFEILEECVDPHVASQREVYWVTHFDSFKNGYNLTPGGGFHVGNRGRKFSEDHKRKLSEAHKGKTFSQESRRKMGEATRKRLLENHPMKGKTWSDEIKQRMSDAKIEFYASDRGEEIKQKISETLKGRSPSPETRQKIGKAGRGRKHSPETIEKLKARIFTEEHRRKLSEAARLREERKRQERD